MIEPKPIAFRGSALEDLRAFPLAARRDAGYQLDRIQNGHEPDDCKPMRTVGPGVKEIRIRDSDAAFRIIYVAPMPFTCCTAFRKKHKKPVKPIGTWLSAGTAIC